MTQVVRSTNGTAYRRFLGLGINIAGKTGTATSAPWRRISPGPGLPDISLIWQGREDLPDIAIALSSWKTRAKGQMRARRMFRRASRVLLFGAPRSLYPLGSPDRPAEDLTPTPQAGAPEEAATPSR
jgi:hypothetical protein